MMSKKLFYLALVGILMGLVGNVGAATVYRDWDNGGGDRLWSNPTNWLPDGLPTKINSGDNRTRIEGTQATGNYPILDATIFSKDPNGAVADRLYVGQKNNTGKLLITGGAKLTTFDDLSMGYDDNSYGTCYVDGRNTLLEIPGGLKVGRRGDGKLIMTGGTINTFNSDVEIPSSTTTASLNKGHLQLSGGTIKCRNLRMREPGGAVIGIGTMDVAGGTLILAGDDTAVVQGFIDNGWITAYGGYGTLQLDYHVRNSLATTLTAVHKLNPSPADGATASNLTGTVPLSWTNLDPNHPGAPVTVDVWFGSDPNKLTAQHLLTGSTASTVNATGIPVVSFGGPYYWWVDTHNGGPKVIESPAFTFYVTNDATPSVFMNTPPMQTWIGQPVQLNITVTDDGLSPVTFLWASSDPNAVFSPSNTVEDPTVTMNYASGTFTVTVTASDGNPLGGTGSASVSINCASSACAAARRSAMGIVNLYPTDIVPDCMHDSIDFAELAKNWLIDYSLKTPTPIP